MITEDCVSSPAKLLQGLFLCLSNTYYNIGGFAFPSTKVGVLRKNVFLASGNVQSRFFYAQKRRINF